MSTAAITRDRTASPSRNWRSRHQLLLFIVLAYGLSWWPVLSRLANPESAPVLPVGPSIAALLVVGWVYGRPARRALLRSAVNVRIGRWWWGAAIPLAVAVVVVVLAVLFGATAPSSSDLAMAAAGALITLPIVLVINGPLGEELGWRGYVLPLFLRRHSPVMATILLIPLWICFHLPLIVTSPDRFGLWWALAVAGTAFPMTWLHLRSGGSVALAIGFHAVMNVATPAAVGLFAGPDRLLAMHLTAVVWVLIGLATAVGLLRRDPDPTDHDGVTRSQVQRLRRFARLLDRVMRKVDGELRVVGDRLRVELDDLSVVLGLAGVDAGAGLLDLLAPGTLDLLRPGYPHSATPSGCAAAAGGSRGRSRRRRSAAACGQ